MSTKQGFFAIGPVEWNRACEIGLNPAVAFLVLARGSGRDNKTTAWSADAVARHTGMSWRRAKSAIGALEAADLAKISKKGKRPIRKLVIPKRLEEALWLPNTLVDGAAGEVPPIARLRQRQNVEHLQAFVELYGLHDLAGDGGLPRDLIVQKFERERIGESGQFIIWGFTETDSRTCWARGPLERFNGKKVEGQHASWHFLEAMERLGTIESVIYLAEGDSPQAELIHPLTGEYGGILGDAAVNAVFALPEWLGYRAEQYNYTVPVIRDIPAPAVVGVSRLVYRPHTSLTSAWDAQNRAMQKMFADTYAALAVGDYETAINNRSADIKVCQG